MDPRLAQDFQKALSDSQGIHIRNVNHDYLGLFKRVARENPEEIQKIVEMYKNHISIHRSNLIASLFGLAEIADVSPSARRSVADNFPSEEIDYYIKEENEDISGNAKVLKAVLSGESLSKFPKKDMNAPASLKLHIGDQITGDKISGNNFGDNSTNFIKSSNISLVTQKIAELDQEVEKNYSGPDKHEIKNIIIEIQEASKKGDKSKTLSFLGQLLTRTAELVTLSPLVIELIRMIAS